MTAWQLRDADAPGHQRPHRRRLRPGRPRPARRRCTPTRSPGSTPLETGCPRLADYGVRLGRAVELALAGDGRYVASPRVDSYHGIWFELHEDLIQLAGRNRADEVAAGRA